MELCASVWKEVTCLYEIRRSLGVELSLDNACQHIFTHLIPALQFPEAATAMIEVERRHFTSEKRARGLTHELQSNITVNKRLCGRLRVFLPGRQAVPDTGRAQRPNQGRCRRRSGEVAGGKTAGAAADFHGGRTPAYDRTGIADNFGQQIAAIELRGRGFGARHRQLQGVTGGRASCCVHRQTSAGGSCENTRKLLAASPIRIGNAWTDNRATGTGKQGCGRLQDQCEIHPRERSCH